MYVCDNEKKREETKREKQREKGRNLLLFCTSDEEGPFSEGAGVGEDQRVALRRRATLCTRRPLLVDTSPLSPLLPPFVRDECSGESKKLSWEGIMIFEALALRPSSSFAVSKVIAVTANGRGGGEGDDGLFGD